MVLSSSRHYCNCSSRRHYYNCSSRSNYTTVVVVDTTTRKECPPHGAESCARWKREERIRSLSPIPPRTISATVPGGKERRGEGWMDGWMEEGRGEARGESEGGRGGRDGERRGSK